MGADDLIPAPAAAPDVASAFSGDGEPSTPAAVPVRSGGDAPARAELPASDSFSEADAAAADSRTDSRTDGPADVARDGKGRFAAHSAAFVARQQQIKTEIDELVRARETARQEAAAARAEAERLRQPAPGSNGHGAPAAPEAEPQLDAYLAQGHPYEAWIKAWNRWDRQQALDARFAQVQQQQTAQQQQVAQQQALEAFGKRIETFVAAHPDYQDVVTQPGLPAPSVAIIEYIQNEDDGPALAYYLAQHPEEITRLVRLGNSKPAFTAMGRLAAGLGTPTLSKPPGVVSSPITNAPPPVTPVTGAGPTATRADDLPFGAEYIRRMNAVDQKRRTGR
jgi:hypothetical protein